MGAIAIIEKHTCVRFQPRNNETEYLFFRGRSTMQCQSEMGRQSSQPTHLDLSAQTGFLRGCFQIRNIVHEIFHALGFMHTHQRPDRDDYVEMHWENIGEGFTSLLHNWYKCRACETFGVPYDCSSIMHYASNAGAVWGKHVLVAKNTTVCKIFTTDELFNITHEDEVMTDNDIAMVNIVYCKNNTNTANTTNTTNTTTNTTNTANTTNTTNTTNNTANTTNNTTTTTNECPHTDVYPLHCHLWNLNWCDTKWME